MLPGVLLVIPPRVLEGGKLIVVQILWRCRFIMKRNILLLTAVVLAAVMLSGCILPFMGIKVSYDLTAVEGVFKEAKLVEKVKKSAKFEPEFEFADATDTREFEAVVMAGETKIESTIEALTDKKGIKVAIPDVGKKDIKITITIKP